MRVRGRGWLLRGGAPDRLSTLLELICHTDSWWPYFSWSWKISGSRDWSFPLKKIYNLCRNWVHYLVNIHSFIPINIHVMIPSVISWHCAASHLRGSTGTRVLTRHACCRHAGQLRLNWDFTDIQGFDSWKQIRRSSSSPRHRRLWILPILLSKKNPGLCNSRDRVLLQKARVTHTGNESLSLYKSRGFFTVSTKYRQMDSVLSQKNSMHTCMFCS